MAEPEPQSELVTLAQAVVDELNAGEFSQEFTAARSFLPKFDMASLAVTKVTVAAQTVKREAISRKAIRREYAVEIAVQKRLGATEPEPGEEPATDDEEADGLMRLVEQIAAFFDFRRLAKLPAAVWLKTEQPTVYDEAHMEQMRVFSSLVTVTFQIAG